MKPKSDIAALEKATDRFLTVDRSAESVGSEIGCWMLPTLGVLFGVVFLSYNPVYLLDVRFWVFAILYVAFAVWSLLKARNVAYEDNVQVESAMEGLRQSLEPFQKKERGRR